MRFSKEHKEQTRQKVLAEAAAAIRDGGVKNISVADVMARAGLTVGGFYAHFKSKDDLVAKAVPFMFDDTYSRFLQDAESNTPAEALSAFIDRYLSVRHRDNPQRGCPMPTLAADLSRMPAQARKNFTAGANRLNESIAQLVAKVQPEHAEELAVSMLAEMVGALSMSRAVHDDAESQKILDISRSALKRRLGLPLKASVSRKG